MTKFVEVNGSFYYKGDDSPKNAGAKACDVLDKTNKEDNVLILDEEIGGETIAWVLHEIIKKEEIERNRIYTHPAQYDVIWLPEENSYNKEIYDCIIRVYEK